MSHTANPEPRWDFIAYSILDGRFYTNTGFNKSHWQCWNNKKGNNWEDNFILNPKVVFSALKRADNYI